MDISLWLSIALVVAILATEALSSSSLKEFTEEELRQFDGKDGGPIYIALKGVVFDVTSHPRGRAMYGQGGYSVFAGRDASVALAKMEMDPAVFETLSMDDLSSDELDTLEHWYSDTFMKKYTVVGRVVASNKPKEA